jgi:predicted transposase YbfD/YdcC
MPRPTASLVEHLGEITDPRIERQKLHQLLDIIVTAICAVICGADTWVDIELFGQSKLKCQNFAVLRHIALNLLNQEQTAKGGSKANRLQCDWNEQYLLKVLGV